MEYCSGSCFHRALYAVLVGISPIVICLFLIGFARLIINCLEAIYFRRKKHKNRRRSSSPFYPTGRSTILYTPVSITELQRIIQGEYQSQQPTDSTSSILNNEDDSIRTSKLTKSKSTKNVAMSTATSHTIANLVVRRNAINTIPFTALFLPVSTPATPTLGSNSEQLKRQPSIVIANQKQDDSPTGTALPTINNDAYCLNRNNLSEPGLFVLQDADTLFTSSISRLSNIPVLVKEESRDYHSASSIPFALN